MACSDCVKNSLVLGFLVIVVCSFSAGYNQEKTGEEKIDLPEYAVEKVYQTLDNVWPHKEIVIKKLTLTKTQLQQADIETNEINLHSLYYQGRLLGYLYLTQAPSKFKQFDYMVIFDRTLSIKKMRVLIYREHYGGEITRQRWLEQFEGKKNGKEMEYNEDIQAISGATISARSITRDVKRVSRNMKKLQTNELLSPTN